MDIATTKVLPQEYAKAKAKVDRRDTRATRMAGYGATTAGMAITTSFIAKLIPVVAAKLATRYANPTRAGDDLDLEFVIRNLEPDVIALATLQGALHSIGASAPLRDTYLSIGRLIERECFVAKLLHHDPKRGEMMLEEAFKERPTSGSRMAALRKTAAKPGVIKKKGKVVGYVVGFQVENWAPALLVKAGAWCVSRLKEALPTVFTVMPMVHIKRPSDKPDTSEILVLTEAGVSVADKALQEAVLNHPVYGPRTTAPADWDRFTSKPSDAVDNKVTLLRTPHKDVKAAMSHAIRTGQAAPALKGVNTLQSVPLRINTWTLNLIEECWQQGIPVPGLPMKSAMNVEHLEPDDFNALTIEARELHARSTKAARKLNLARIGDTVSFEEDSATAHQMAEAERFYVPMNMDWRGRVYGFTFFNFQREDRVRSLFLFANGKPITERGIYWLKVHVANCAAFKGEDKIGIDKKPLDERVKWVDDHLEQIRAAVEWPTGRAHQWWRDADAPFLFLAASRELLSALDAGSQYVTHMPVSFDGSCSGIQHLSCAMRAEEGRYVNLTDNEVPEDIYERVAILMKAAIELDLVVNVDELIGDEFEKAEKARRYAKLALDYGVNRKLVKRNVMTFPYSSKVFGMGQQQLVDTMEPLQVEVLKGIRKEHPFGDESTQYGAAKYLARHAYSAIKKLVEKPAEAMAFLQGLTKQLAREGKPLRWVTPVGLPWINRYHEPVTERVYLTLNENGVKLKQEIVVGVDFKPEIDKERAANAVSPNFVHALDASHLLLTVGACADEGITDIVTVHDSFGCHPSEGDRFNEIIRATMVRMYTEHDVLEEILARAREDLSPAGREKLPAAAPVKGTLNLEEIRNAKYAFA
jgi:DNA-directed RNA polymerase, mitochondrial